MLIKQSFVAGGDAGTLHAVSSAPHVVYTIQKDSQEVKCLDIGPALGFRPDLSAAAWNQNIIVSDASVCGSNTGH